MKAKILLLVDNFGRGKQIINLIDIDSHQAEIIGIEYNGALGLERFRQFLPQIVILDSSIPIIGIDKFVQLMQSYTIDFTIILLDDKGGLDANNIQNIYRILPKTNLTSSALNEAISLSIDLFMHDKKELSYNFDKSYYDNITSIIGDGNFSFSRLQRLCSNEFGWNLTPSVHILLFRPKKLLTSIPLKMLNDIQSTLNTYNGGSVMVMDDGIICVIINFIESTRKNTSESLYEKLLYEIGYMTRHIYQISFLLCLSNECKLRNMANEYTELRKIYDYGFFLQDVNLIKTNSINRPLPKVDSKLLDDSIKALTSALFDDNYSAFEQHLEVLYLSTLKSSLQFSALQEVRIKLELLHYSISLLYAKEDISSDCFANIYMTIEEEYKAVNGLFMELHRDLMQKQLKLNSLTLQTYAFTITSLSQQSSLSSAADALNVTPSYLSHLFKKEAGVTFSNYLMNIRVKCAKRLLLNSQNKIYEISELVGFSDVHYFSSAFRKLTALTPTNYRVRMLRTPNIPKVI